MDYKHIEILPLYSKPIYLHEVGADGLICGWGTVLQDDVCDDATGDEEYSQNLHCMNVELLSQLHCRQVFLSRDYKRKLMCGQSLERRQKITSVIASQNCVYV